MNSWPTSETYIYGIAIWTGLDHCNFNLEGGACTLLCKKEQYKSELFEIAESYHVMCLTQN